jgi:RNA polymerase sigma-54 factor
VAVRPGLGAGISVRQGQRLALTPALRLSLEMLRLPLADLAAEVAREAAENPFLIVEWPRRRGGAGGAAYEMALGTVADEPSLVENLRRQLALMTLPDRVAALADYLAGDLREDGYLDTPLDDYAARLGAGRDELAAALAALQSCEPAGVGARDLAECLALQLRDQGLPEELATRIIANLDRFGAGDIGALGRALGVSQAEARRLAGIVRGLRAQPVDPEETPAAQMLAPDLIVSRDNRGALKVETAQGAAPALWLDDALLDRAGPGVFADGCRDRGRTLIRALAQRRETLERIGAVLVEAQHRFFALGPDQLVPLSRADLAHRLDLHPSTVGRAVADKALEHDGRLYPLSMFFSVGLAGTVARGGPVSANVARLALARIVAREDPGAPLSDAVICDRLRAEGVDITRRTVAKYRGCLAIPSSHERRLRNRRRGLRARVLDGPSATTA